ncbi:MAG: PAC2 family protein, partial [Candidatus Aenigmatarchaeota archaeon]
YEVAGKILEFIRALGCKEVITIGGFSTGKITEKPKVFGIATDADVAKDLKRYDIETKVTGQIGTIVGASGLILGIGKMQGMKGFVLLGETSGFPIITDPTAAESVLIVLQKIINIKVDLTKLEEKVKAMHEFIKKLEEIQSQAMEQMQKSGKKPEELKYIG